MKEDLELLIARYLEGSATPEEVRELDRLLQEDPASRRRFILAAAQEFQLRELCVKAPEPGAGEAAPVERLVADRPDDQRRITTRRATRRHYGARKSSWFLGWMAAGLLVGVAVLVILIASEPVPPAAGTSGGGRPRTGGKAAPDVDEATRRRAQERLQEIDRERRRLTDTLAQAPAKRDAKREEDSRQALARLDEERRRVEAEMKEAIDRARKERFESAPPEVAKEAGKGPPVPEPGNLPPPAPANKPSQTQPEIAVIKWVEGKVSVGTGIETALARGGQALLSGQGLRTEEKGAGVLVQFPDGTRLELPSDASIREISDGAGGKRIVMAHGTLTADVARQPQDRPMVIQTPHAESRVLGTTLRIVVDPGEKGSTRLDVREGKVRLTRSLDAKTVDVMSGHYAVAAVGVELVAKRSAPSRLVGYWKFDDLSGRTAKDASGHGNDGKLMNAPVWVEGRFGGALRLDGVKDYVDVGKRPALNLSGDFTFGLWVKVDRLPAGEVHLLGNLNVQRNVGQYELRMTDDGKVNFHIKRADPPDS